MTVPLHAPRPGLTPCWCRGFATVIRCWRAAWSCSWYQLVCAETKNRGPPLSQWLRDAEGKPAGSVLGCPLSWLKSFHLKLCFDTKRLFEKQASQKNKHHLSSPNLLGRLLFLSEFRSGLGQKCITLFFFFLLFNSSWQTTPNYLSAKLFLGDLWEHMEW